MIKEETYVTFGIAPYCIARLLLAFNQQGINDFWITQMDSNLYVRVPVSCLEEIVYKVKDLCLPKAELKIVEQPL